jgi:hypothetical protein
VGHFNHDLVRFVSGAEEQRVLHGRGEPMGSGARRERLETAKQFMAAGAEHRSSQPQRTSFPADQFADRLDHRELTDVATGMVEQLSGEPPEALDGFRQLVAQRVAELEQLGHHPDDVGAWAAADVSADIERETEQVVVEREARSDARDVVAWMREEYGRDAVREFERDLASMEESDRDAAVLELQARYAEAGGQLAPGFDPAAELEQAFDADADGPGPVNELDYGEAADWMESTFEGGVDAMVEWLDSLPEEQLDVELDRLDARYEAHMSGEPLLIDVLEDAGYDAAEVEAWLDGMSDEEAIAAAQELLGEAQHVLAGGEPAEGYADEQASSGADRWRQLAADEDGYQGDEYDDGGADDGYADQGGEPAYAGASGYDGGE